MSRRALTLGLLVPLVTAVVVVVVAAAGNERDLVLRGNGFAAEAVPLRPGTRVCQRNLLPSISFSGVRTEVASAGGSAGPALDVSVRRGGRRVATGTLAGGYVLQGKRSLELDRPVPGGRPVTLCVANQSSAGVVLFGSVSGARGMEVSVAGRDRTLALVVDLTRRPSSALSLAGTITDRLSVMRPDPVGPWVFWLLLAGFLIGAPVLLVRATGRAASMDRDDAAQPEAD